MGDRDSDQAFRVEAARLEEVQQQFEAIRKRIREIERKALAKLVGSPDAVVSPRDWPCAAVFRYHPRRPGP